MKTQVVRAITLAAILQGLLATAPTTARADQPMLRQNASPADHLAVIDALHRFTWGMDTDNPEMIRSAFAEDGVADFSPAAKTLGITFPPLEGRDVIGKALGPFVAGLITSHTVGNARVEVNGNTARLHALVEAQQIPAGDRSRHLLLKNRYNVTLVREGDGWLIKRMTIDNLWSHGDLKVITGG